MKLFVLLVAVFAGIWLWKRGRRLAQSKEPSRPGPKSRKVQTMLSCPVCGVHVPSTDAVEGKQNSYCSVAHRRQAEGS